MVTLTPNLGLYLNGPLGSDKAVGSDAHDWNFNQNMVIIDAFAAGGGSGSSVYVNGTKITSPNFNGATPAAPAGKTNVLFQVDGSGNISAYFTPGTAAAWGSITGTLTSQTDLTGYIATAVGSETSRAEAAESFLTKAAATNLTAQSANVGNTTVYAVPADGAGLYEVDVVMIVSRAASSSSTLPDSQINYTDQDSGVNILIPVTTGNTGNTTSTYSYGRIVVNCKASTNLQFNIGQLDAYASTGGTLMQFSYRNRVRFLG